MGNNWNDPGILRSSGMYLWDCPVIFSSGTLSEILENPTIS